MNVETIKTLKDMDKYYSLDYLISLIDSVSKIFTKCDINNYLRVDIESVIRKEGINIIDALPKGERLKLTMYAKSRDALERDEFKQLWMLADSKVLSKLDKIYGELFDKVVANLGTIRDNINSFDKDKLCEFEAIAEWLLLLYCKTSASSFFRSNISSNSVKKYFELKHYFIKDYGYECWLAFVILSLDNYFTAYKNFNETDKKKFKIFDNIPKVVRPRNFKRKLYSKIY